jgi:hypothetical protein
MAQAVDQNFLNSDPEIQAIIKQAPSNGTFFASQKVTNAIKDALARRGLALPDNYHLSGPGQLNYNDPVDWKKIAIIGGAAVGAPIAAAALGGSAAAGAGGAALGPTTAGSMAATTAGAAAPASIAAGGAGTAATVAAGAGGASLWKTLAAPAIGAGAQVAGSLIQANQNDKATQAELQKAREAQAFLEKKYEQTQNQVAPYVNMGQGALAALGNGLGVTPANPAVLQPGQSRPVGQTTSGFIPPDDFTSFKQTVQAQNPTATIPNMPQQNPAAQAQNLSQSSVRLQSPDGKDVQDVPASQAQYFISKGAKVVQS